MPEGNSEFGTRYHKTFDFYSEMPERLDSLNNKGHLNQVYISESLFILLV